MKNRNCNDTPLYEYIGYKTFCFYSEKSGLGQVKLKGLKIKGFIDPTGIKQYLTKPSKDHHINLKSSVREEKIGRAI